MNFDEWFSQSSEMEMLKPAFELGWSACAADRIGFLEREIERIRYSGVFVSPDYFVEQLIQEGRQTIQERGEEACRQSTPALIIAALEYLKEQAQKEMK